MTVSRHRAPFTGNGNGGVGTARSREFLAGVLAVIDRYEDTTFLGEDVDAA